MNVAYLENLSITTMIVPHTLDLSKPMIRSMLKFSYGALGVGNGSNNPARF